MFYGYICYLGLPFFIFSRPNFEEEAFKSCRRAVARLLSEKESPEVNMQLRVVRDGLQKLLQERERADIEKEALVITSFFKAPCFRLFFQVFFFFWVASFVMLGVLGAQPVEYPYTGLSALATGYYFFFLLFLI
jgi:hypothetical protein